MLGLVLHEELSRLLLFVILCLVHAGRAVIFFLLGFGLFLLRRLFLRGLGRLLSVFLVLSLGIRLHILFRDVFGRGTFVFDGFIIFLLIVLFLGLVFGRLLLVAIVVLFCLFLSFFFAFVFFFGFFGLVLMLIYLLFFGFMLLRLRRLLLFSFILFVVAFIWLLSGLWLVLALFLFRLLSFVLSHLLIELLLGLVEGLQAFLILSTELLGSLSPVGLMSEFGLDFILFFLRLRL